MVSLSIKNVPEELADYLRKRAEENNRSLQEELLTILEESVEGNHTPLDHIATHVENSGLKTEDDATQTVRHDRDHR